MNIGGRIPKVDYKKVSCYVRTYDASICILRSVVRNGDFC